MEAQPVEHPYWNGDVLVVLVQNVPAWCCQLCAHRYFDPAVETTLRYIVKDYLRAGQFFPIPSTLYRSDPRKS